MGELERLGPIFLEANANKCFKGRGTNLLDIKVKLKRSIVITTFSLRFLLSFGTAQEYCVYIRGSERLP